MLQGGRCLPTCTKGEFSDKDSNSCKSCDDSCTTCSASGADQCLSCTDGEVLRLGRCVRSNGGCQTLKGLGVCLNDLVIIPNSTTGADIPEPSITGITSPTEVKTGNKLKWWQILLMALGGIFIGLVMIILWHRHARKKRAEKTRAQREVFLVGKVDHGGEEFSQESLENPTISIRRRKIGFRDIVML